MIDITSIKIIPLNNVPEYYPILSFWSYKEWYLKRNIEFDVVLKDYKRRGGTLSLPFTSVAVCNSMPVGMASLKENDLWSRKDINPWLSSLYVIPEFRGRGIGERLTVEIQKKASVLNYKKIYLFLGNSESGLLKNFYQKRGWKYFDHAIDNDGNDTEIYIYNLSE